MQSRQRRFQYIDRRQVALGEAPGHLAGGKPVQIVGHRAAYSAASRAGTLGSISHCRISVKRLNAPHSEMRHVSSTIWASEKCSRRRVKISSRVLLQLLFTATEYST